MAPLFRSASVAGSASVMSGSSSRWDIDCNNDHSQWHSLFYLFISIYHQVRVPLYVTIYEQFFNDLYLFDLWSPGLRHPPWDQPQLQFFRKSECSIFIQGKKIVRWKVSIFNIPFIFPYGKDIIFDDLWPTIAISNQDFPRSKRKYVRR